MADEVKLPRLGQGMESGTIVKWLKAEGDRVEKGEPLYEVDTDKATQEVEAEASGVLLAIAVAVGEVPVGRDGRGDRRAGRGGRCPRLRPPETPAASRSAAPAEPSAGAGRVPRGAQRCAARPSGAGGRVKASPLARRMARERGLDLGAAHRHRARWADRRRGRRAGRASAPPPPARAAGPAPPRRRRPRRPRLPARSSRSRSRTSAARSRAGSPRRGRCPVFQLTVSVDMTHANALLERSRELNPDVRVTVTDLLARVCAQALMRHPDVNVQFTDEALLRFPSANVGIAVAAPQGLVVPVIRSVERLSLTEVAAPPRRARRPGARRGALQLADLEGGTFTISNLGMFGDRAVHRRAQPAAGGDPRGRRDRRPAGRASTARSSCGR